MRNMTRQTFDKRKNELLRWFDLGVISNEQYIDESNTLQDTFEATNQNGNQ